MTTTTAAHTAARAIVTADTVEQAHAIAAQLRGAAITAVAALLGVHLHGRVADRRQQLVAHSIGRAMTAAAVGTPQTEDGRTDRAAAAARVQAWRQRMLERLDG